MSEKVRHRAVEPLHEELCVHGSGVFVCTFEHVSVWKLINVVSAVPASCSGGLSLCLPSQLCPGLSLHTPH